MPTSGQESPPTSLGMAPTMQQERFADTFLLAVAAAAGCDAVKPVVDDDSIDWTLNCKLRRRPKLDVQMKSTRSDDGRGPAISHPLRRKNYDDLILAEVLAPRILVLVVVPPDPAEWLAVTPDQLVLRRCAYWVSLAGWPASANERSVTVPVPRANVFTVEALVRMLQHINEGGAP